MPLGYSAFMEPWTSEDRQALGLRLKNARERAGRLQVDVGAMFGKGKAMVSAWEKGRNMPNAEQVARLADEFSVSIEWLLTGVSAQPLSPELRKRLSAMPAESVRLIENSIRGQLDMAPIGVQPAPLAPPEKPQARLAA